MWSADELIVAPATPDGPGCRAIVRLAGDGLDTLLATLFEPEAGTSFSPVRGPPRVVPARCAGELGAAWGRLPVDILHWPGPTGPVGGPLAEIHLPCSAPLVDAVIATACRHGARLARGGEFTLRAFLAGRLDLLQAEAVLAVVDAATPAELSAALDRLAGGAGVGLARVRDRLLDVLADVEASIDFSDETTPDAAPAVDVASWRRVADRIAEARLAIHDARALLAGRATAGSDSPRVVLVGPPNIGKSSLFNAIAGRETALVADESGTTRDRLEARFDCVSPQGGAVACVLVDVAGVVSDGAHGPDDRAGAADDAAEAVGPGRRHATGTMEPATAAAGVARRALADADVVVVCRDAATGAGPAPLTSAGRPRIDVLTRSDRVPRPLDNSESSAGTPCIATSSVTREGILELAEAIAVAVAALPPRGSPATVRLAVGLDEAARELSAAEEMFAAAPGTTAVDEALLAGRLRAAAAALSEVTGVDLGPDLLDRVFSRHCIGK